MKKSTNLSAITTEDLKATLNLYDLNKRNLTTESSVGIRNNALACARELEKRIGPNVYSSLAGGAR